MTQVDYHELSGKLVRALKMINRLARVFSKYELVEPVRDEVKSMVSLSSRRSINKLLKEEPKEAYAEMINHLLKIEDSIYEIDLLTGDLIKRANELPDEERTEFYKELGIGPINPEYEGLSDELNNKLKEINHISSILTDESDLLYSEENEDYIDVVESSKKQ